MEQSMDKPTYNMETELTPQAAAIGDSLKPFQGRPQQLSPQPPADIPAASSIRSVSVSSTGSTPRRLRTPRQKKKFTSGCDSVLEHIVSATNNLSNNIATKCGPCLGPVPAAMPEEGRGVNEELQVSPSVSNEHMTTAETNEANMTKYSSLEGKMSRNQTANTNVTAFSTLVEEQHGGMHQATGDKSRTYPPSHRTATEEEKLERMIDDLSLSLTEEFPELERITREEERKRRMDEELVIIGGGDAGDATNNSDNCFGWCSSNNSENAWKRYLLNGLESSKRVGDIGDVPVEDLEDSGEGPDLEGSGEAPDLEGGGDLYKDTPVHRENLPTEDKHGENISIPDKEEHAVPASVAVPDPSVPPQLTSSWPLKNLRDGLSPSQLQESLAGLIRDAFNTEVPLPLNTFSAQSAQSAHIPRSAQGVSQPQPSPYTPLLNGSLLRETSVLNSGVLSRGSGSLMKEPSSLGKELRGIIGENGSSVAANESLLIRTCSNAPAESGVSKPQRTLFGSSARNSSEVGSLQSGIGGSPYAEREELAINTSQQSITKHDLKSKVIESPTSPQANSRPYILNATSGEHLKKLTSTLNVPAGKTHSSPSSRYGHHYPGSSGTGATGAFGNNTNALFQKINTDFRIENETISKEELLVRRSDRIEYPHYSDAAQLSANFPTHPSVNYSLNSTSQQNPSIHPDFKLREYRPPSLIANPLLSDYYSVPEFEDAREYLEEETTNKKKDSNNKNDDSNQDSTANIVQDLTKPHDLTTLINYWHLVTETLGKLAQIDLTTTSVAAAAGISIPISTPVRPTSNTSYSVTSPQGNSYNKNQSYGGIVYPKILGKGAVLSSLENKIALQSPKSIHPNIGSSNIANPVFNSVITATIGELVRTINEPIKTLKGKEFYSVWIDLRRMTTGANEMDCWLHLLEFILAENPKYFHTASLKDVEELKKNAIKFYSVEGKNVKQMMEKQVASGMVASPMVAAVSQNTTLVTHPVTQQVGVVEAQKSTQKNMFAINLTSAIETTNLDDRNWDNPPVGKSQSENLTNASGMTETPSLGQKRRISSPEMISSMLHLGGKQRRESAKIVQDKEIIVEALYAFLSGQESDLSKESGSETAGKESGNEAANDAGRDSANETVKEFGTEAEQQSSDAQDDAHAPEDELSKSLSECVVKRTISSEEVMKQMSEKRESLYQRRDSAKLVANKETLVEALYAFLASSENTSKRSSKVSVGSDSDEKKDKGDTPIGQRLNAQTVANALSRLGDEESGKRSNGEESVKRANEEDLGKRVNEKPHMKHPPLDSPKFSDTPLLRSTSGPDSQNSLSPVQIDSPACESVLKMPASRVFATASRAKASGQKLSLEFEMPFETPSASCGGGPPVSITTLELETPSGSGLKLIKRQILNPEKSPESPSHQRRDSTKLADGKETLEEALYAFLASENENGGNQSEGKKTGHDAENNDTSSSLTDIEISKKSMDDNSLELHSFQPNVLPQRLEQLKQQDRSDSLGIVYIPGSPTATPNNGLNPPTNVPGYVPGFSGQEQQKPNNRPTFTSSFCKIPCSSPDYMIDLANYRAGTVPAEYKAGNYLGSPNLQSPDGINSGPETPPELRLKRRMISNPHVMKNMSSPAVFSIYQRRDTAKLVASKKIFEEALKSYKLKEKHADSATEKPKSRMSLEIDDENVVYAEVKADDSTKLKGDELMSSMRRDTNTDKKDDTGNGHEQSGAGKTDKTKEANKTNPDLEGHDEDEDEAEKSRQEKMLRSLQELNESTQDDIAKAKEIMEKPLLEKAVHSLPQVGQCAQQIGHSEPMSRHEMNQVLSSTQLDSILDAKLASPEIDIEQILRDERPRPVYPHEKTQLQKNGKVHIVRGNQGNPKTTQSAGSRSTGNQQRSAAVAIKNARGISSVVDPNHMLPASHQQGRSATAYASSSYHQGQPSRVPAAQQFRLSWTQSLKRESQSPTIRKQVEDKFKKIQADYEEFASATGGGKSQIRNKKQKDWNTAPLNTGKKITPTLFADTLAINDSVLVKDSITLQKNLERAEEEALSHASLVGQPRVTSMMASGAPVSHVLYEGQYFPTLSKESVQSEMIESGVMQNGSVAYNPIHSYSSSQTMHSQTYDPQYIQSNSGHPKYPANAASDSAYFNPHYPTGALSGNQTGQAYSAHGHDGNTNPNHVNANAISHHQLAAHTVSQQYQFNGSPANNRVVMHHNMVERGPHRAGHGNGDNITGHFEQPKFLGRKDDGARFIVDGKDGSRKVLRPVGRKKSAGGKGKSALSSASSGAAKQRLSESASAGVNSSYTSADPANSTSRILSQSQPVDASVQASKKGNSSLKQRVRSGKEGKDTNATNGTNSASGKGHRITHAKRHGEIMSNSKGGQEAYNPEPRVMAYAAALAGNSIQASQGSHSATGQDTNLPRSYYQVIAELHDGIPKDDGTPGVSRTNAASNHPNAKVPRVNNTKENSRG